MRTRWRRVAGWASVVAVAAAALVVDTAVSDAAPADDLAVCVVSAGLCAKVALGDAGRAASTAVDWVAPTAAGPLAVAVAAVAVGAAAVVPGLGVAGAPLVTDVAIKGAASRDVPTGMGLAETAGRSCQSLGGGTSRAVDRGCATDAGAGCRSNCTWPLTGAGRPALAPTSAQVADCAQARLRPKARCSARTSGRTT
jgi:hypothetical protein